MTLRPAPLFCRIMRDAIREGRKTQTRRVLKPQPTCDIEGAYFDAYDGGPQWNWWTADNKVCNAEQILTCPHGQPGDYWYLCEPLQAARCGGTRYAEEPLNWAVDNNDYTPDWKWKRPKLAAVYMPRWAARTFMHVEAVRVERLQEIGHKSLEQEGCLPKHICGGELEELVRAFWIPLWDRLNAKRGHPWASNPWVWVYQFTPC